jgi:RpiB/LacA/LacB family sugar-phosphate isomerase
MKPMKIALGADHAGYEFKAEMMNYITGLGHKVVDCGAPSPDSSDYPDYALRVGKVVASGRCDRGILVCGTGIGMAIAANKVQGIRAAACWSVKTAILSVQHNWANVLCIPARCMKNSTAKKMVEKWLKTTPEKGGRHERRVKKILKIESKQ